MNIKASDSADKNFYISIDKGNITMEYVMEQLRAMSTHLIKDWIIFVFMIYNHTYRSTVLSTNFKLKKLRRPADVSNGTFKIAQKHIFCLRI